MAEYLPDNSHEWRRTWRYHTWSGRRASVVAATIAFTAHHVVWRDHEGRIVLAEKTENVNELTEADHLGSATRGVREERRTDV